MRAYEGAISGISYNLGGYFWLVVGCGSLEGLGVEVVSLYGALLSGRFSGCGLNGLGGW